MGLFTSTRYDNLQDLFRDQIQDLYDAEQRLTSALPKMRDAAHDPELKKAFENHLRETHTHVDRLERVFGLLGEQPQAKTCDAMKGLIAEGEEVLSAEGDRNVRDAAIIAAAQRVEHYEIAGYGTARSFADRLGLASAVDLLQETLNEEGAADDLLSEIAEQQVNSQAMRA